MQDKVQEALTMVASSNALELSDASCCVGTAGRPRLSRRPSSAAPASAAATAAETDVFKSEVEVLKPAAWQSS